MRHRLQVAVDALEKIVKWVEHKGNQLGERYTYAAEKHGREAPETRAASNRLHDFRNANLNTLGYAKQALTEISKAGAVAEHRAHGRGTDEPEDSDCPCRVTKDQAACAAVGCGFCRAAARYERDMRVAEAVMQECINDSGESWSLDLAAIIARVK